MPYFNTADGLKLSYSDRGAGRVILCLAGLTRNQSDFDEFLVSTDLKARIICLTSRGRAPSDFDTNWGNYNVLQETQDAVALLDHLEIDRTMIIGTSRGGLIGMVMAQLYPDRITGLVLNDIGPEIPKEGLTRIRSYLGITHKWLTLDAAILDTKAALGEQFPNLSDERWALITARWNGYSNGKFESTYDSNLKKSFDQTNPDVDLWPFFDAIGEKPIGVIWGINSDLLTRQIVEKMKLRNPRLHVAEVPDRGHVPFLDEDESKSLIARVFSECQI